MRVETAAPWYTDHVNLSRLAAWMADEGYAAREVAAMLEKPWHYGDEWERAQKEHGA